ncbi:Oidioi.mRNA.OKI2018_I69.chr1.g333.t1.cds [Oikopleura dioica]|uniref:Oidioi.mRNA.OKI2018_I69.chr1.g333.t1.cds n=1 Tax=Oikopleura dioica TaxID=34765 RepID=A0ABN7SNY5_OIKDI|nr:Oidioi.mRNA.OKI2018_I69.chr1.g333.t1.cds [Oikopleura dioica]
MNPCTRGLLRSQIRKKKMIPGSFVTDVCLHCFCSNCAMIQEAKELNSMDRLLNGNSIAPAEKTIART